METERLRPVKTQLVADVENEVIRDFAVVIVPQVECQEIEANGHGAVRSDLYVGRGHAVQVYHELLALF